MREDTVACDLPAERGKVIIYNIRIDQVILNQVAEVVSVQDEVSDFFRLISVTKAHSVRRMILC